MNRILTIALSVCALLPPLSVRAQYAANSGTNNPPANAAESRLDTVQVTATRFGEQVQEVPLSISVIRGEELRARGADDLRTALALLGGVSVAPGGDAGPAAAVPGLLGLREVDDLLLLIDGIPAGGAFIPQFEAISLNNVERIEVLRGTAPVYFGTTAFAGTINVIHYAAGQSEHAVALSYGSFGSTVVRAAVALSDAPVAQSISGEIASSRMSDPRAKFNRAEGNYRLATQIADGCARVDLNLLLLRQKPGSPTPVDDSGNLTSELPVDFNQNPNDSRLDTDRYQVTLGYDKTTSYGEWGTALSLSHTKLDSVRGFLVDDFADVTGDNAIGSVQSRKLLDVFLDSHLTARPAPWLTLTDGFNELYGHVTQDSRSFSYGVPLDGSAVVSSDAGTPLDASTLTDTRSFFGIYSQARVVLSPQASLLAGIRWNQTRETRTSSDAEGDSVNQQQRNSRLSGSLGGQLKVWSDDSADLDDITVHASVGNTFQPPQIDFGPDAGSDPLLRPETQSSLEFGVKADGLDGRFDLDLSGFWVNFNNQAVATDVGGTPALTNGGRERFKGVEVESSLRITPALTLAAHASYSDARYRDFDTLVAGSPTQLAGKSLPMNAKPLAGAGITFAPAHGWRASLTANYAGRRYLDPSNTVPVGGYTVLDAALGYRLQQVAVVISGSNLSNRRDPILTSELGEGQFYRLPSRRILFTIVAPVQ